MPNELLLTQDGSHSLLSERFEVTYHSKYGAIGETQHVFIDAGLSYVRELKKKQPIRIFEMGFGTGLNAFMSYLEAAKTDIHIDYHTIEKYPLQLATVQKLNYYVELQAEANKELFLNMHTVDSRERAVLSEQFRFTKIIGDVLKEDLPLEVDVIYYDAFAPRSQPELWTAPLLSKLYATLNPQGVLVTYCAQGAFKRALKEVGFQIEGIPGPHGKREMTRAHKPN